MPLLPLLSIAAGVAGNALTAGSNRKINKDNINFQWQMYDKQRGDALTDYNMQNQYNSPAAQMARLKAANLNPNLVYDNGGATAQAASVRSAQPGTPSSKPTHYDSTGVQQGLMSIYDMANKSAQTDNIKALTEVAKQEQALKVAQTAQTGAQTAQTAATTAKTQVDSDRAAFDLKQAQNLSAVTIEQANANLNKTYADTKYTLNQDERAAALNAQSVKEAAERILTLRLGRAKTQEEISHIRAQVSNLQSDTRIKDLDANMKKMGIQPHDPAFSRAVQNIVNGFTTPAEKQGLSDVRKYGPKIPWIGWK